MSFEDQPNFTCYTCSTSIKITCSHGAPLPPNPKDAEIAALIRQIQIRDKETTALLASLAIASEALELIGKSPRNDGTYNRCREACEKLARDALESMKAPTGEEK